MIRQRIGPRVRQGFLMIMVWKDPRRLKRRSPCCRSMPPIGSRPSFTVWPGGAGGRAVNRRAAAGWANTKSLKSAFGIPLLLRCVPSFGPVPQHIWTELREASHALNAFTCAGRVLLIGHPDPFATKFEAIIDSSAIYALPTTLLAGMIDPPRGLSGQVLEHFPDNFVSGWVGVSCPAAGKWLTKAECLPSVHSTLSIF